MTLRDLLLAIGAVPRWIGALNPFAAGAGGEGEDEALDEFNPKYLERIERLKQLDADGKV